VHWNCFLDECNFEDFAGVLNQMGPDLAQLVGELTFDPEVVRARYIEERDKRIRDDGNDQYVEVTADFTSYVDDLYVEPGFTREPLTDEVDFTIVGGGFGGLPIRARMRLAGFDKIRIIERGGDVGGTIARDVNLYVFQTWVTGKVWDESTHCGPSKPGRGDRIQCRFVGAASKTISSRMVGPISIASSPVSAWGGQSVSWPWMGWSGHRSGPS
jgi:hypothetical protein